MAYLDPRPDPTTIGRAYATYYTHGGTTDDAFGQAAAGVERVKAALRNGYINRAYGYNLAPATPLGPLLVPRLGVTKSRSDRSVRLLCRPDSPEGGRLLDVGCGNGEFLLRMRNCGWRVSGLDFDPNAVEACRRSGIDAHLGTLEDAGFEPGSFDAVTMAHVIEHVHDPPALLRACCRVLKPGGKLYVETPNIDGAGHGKYGRHWRGLEPPRHLVIFTGSALQEACEVAGFGVDRLEGVAAGYFLNQQSMAIRDGRDPYGPDGWPAIPARTVRDWKREDRGGVRRPERADIIMLLACKE